MDILRIELLNYELFGAMQNTGCVMYGICERSQTSHGYQKPWKMKYLALATLNQAMLPSSLVSVDFRMGPEQEKVVSGFPWETV